jgi:hypothetical protein
MGVVLPCESQRIGRQLHPNSERSEEEEIEDRQQNSRLEITDSACDNFPAGPEPMERRYRPPRDIEQETLTPYAGLICVHGYLRLRFAHN